MLKRLLFGLTFLSSIAFASQSLTTDSQIKSLYEQLHLKNKLDYSTFSQAIKGYNKIPNKKEGKITIVDFAKPSNEERFFVIDLENKKVDYSTYVSHGKNTGTISAIKFSNVTNSFQSSLGFFLTANPYEGNNGYSLRLKGLEPGINSNAFRRNIVIHGADYATKEFIEKYGFLGRSLGCPAIPTDISKEVIDYIKEGTVLYIHGDDSEYFEKSIYASL